MGLHYRTDPLFAGTNASGKKSQRHRNESDYSWHWGSEEQSPFERFIECLATPPMLATNRQTIPPPH